MTTITTILATILACGSRPAPTGDVAPAGAGPTASRGAGHEPTVTELGGPRDTLVIAYQADAETMIPVVSQSAADSDIQGNIYLDTVGYDFDCELKPRPELATSWEFSEDSKVLRMHLRDGLRWSDGNPVTAADLAFTYDLVADPRVASPRISYIERMDPEARPLVIDDHDLEFHFTQAYDRTTMLSHAGLTPMPHLAMKGEDRSTLRGSPFGKSPVIDGPFRIAEWVPNQKIVLEPNPDFSGPEQMRPRLRRVIFKIIPEYATRLVELENGSVDMMQAILLADADRLAREHPEIELHRRGYRSMDYVAWNAFDPADHKARAARLSPGERLDWSKVAPNPLFGDPQVRRAMTLAIDIDKLIADLLTSKVTGEVYARRSVSTITPELCSVYDDSIQPLPHDPARARSLLASAGWADTDGDGIADKDGRPFRFTLLTNSGNSRRAQAAVVIQANLREIGVDMRIEQVESNTFFERLRKKDYEAALSGWSAGLFVDMSSFWHSGDRYEFNFVGYDNPEVDRLIEQALQEPDPQANAALWRRVQRLIYQDQPYTFLYWMDEIDGLHERFEDPKIDLLSALHDLYSWWVPAGEVRYER